MGCAVWLLPSLVALAGCGGVGGVCYDDHYANVTAYTVRATQRSPSGIAVDGALDLGELDRRTAAVEACLAARFPDGRMPAALVAAAHCLTDRVELVVHRECLTVKVAPDWHVGCAGEQVFPCSVDPALCQAKGLTPTAACPCECRSAIQDDGTIVVTPDLRLYANDLMRLQTSCNDIWVPGLEECFQ